MSHTPHEISEDFPGQADKISALRDTDAHFATLLTRYHTLNRAVHRAETDVEPKDDLYMSEMRKERLHLKDTISAAISAV